MDLNSILFPLILASGSILALVLAYAGVKYASFVKERISNSAVAGIKAVLKILGLSGDTLDRYLSTQVESQVSQVKPVSWPATDSAS